MDRLHPQEFSEELINNLTAQFRQLVSENWTSMWACRGEEPDSIMKGAVSFSIAPCGREYTLSSAFSYGIRYRHRTNGKCTYASDEARAA